LGGHLVQGHVDGVGQVRSVETVEESVVLWVEIPIALRRYVAVKGSIALDGTSLTINEIVDGIARINLIPHTVESTHLAQHQVGDAMNVEIDLVARYVERLVVPIGGPHE
jgi:riboflavin synthase